MAESTTTGAEKKPRWIDTTINLQTLLGSVIGGGIALAFAYFGVVRDVAALKQTDQEHERRFARVESDIRQTRDDTSQQLRAMGADMREQLNVVSNDVKDIRRYLMDNAAGARPDIKRWTR